jgi:hypothetical protein
LYNATLCHPVSRKASFQSGTFFIGHSLPLGEEKRKDLIKHPSCPYCKQTHVYKVGVNKTGRKPIRDLCIRSGKFEGSRACYAIRDDNFTHFAKNYSEVEKCLNLA